MNTENDLRTIIDERDGLIRRLTEERDVLALQNQEKESTIKNLVQRVVTLEQRTRLTPLHKLLYKWLVRFVCKTPHPLGVLRQHPPRPLKSPPPPPPAPDSAPGFCILTPSYAQGRFIERTLRSVLDQSYPKVRYGVQDGGSMDETVDILHRYAPRLAYHDSRPDEGQAHAINTGFLRLEPHDDEIMAWLNSDDLLLPGTLARVADYFERHPDVDVVYGHRVIIDEQDRDVGRWYLPQHRHDTLNWVDFVPQETLFWRARAWKKTGGLDDSFAFALDWSFLLKLESAGCRIRRIPEFLGCFRVHEAQKTHLHIGETGLREMNRLRTKHGVDSLEAERRIRVAIRTESLRSGWIHRLWSLGIKI
jgi:carbamoyltransferase